MNLFRRFRPLLLTLVFLSIGHLLLAFPSLPLWFRTVAVLVITWAVPGYWLVRALRGESPRTLQEQLEWVVLAGGAGYVVQVLAMTLLSYLPGGITPLQTLLTFNAVTLLLIGAAYFIPSRHETDPAPPPSATPPGYIRGMVVIVILIAGVFRLPDLGYSEFQGDEARAILKAAALVQGHEEALFLYRKGPTEIVVTAIGYSLTGQLTEASSRLPYTLAGMLLPIVLFLIGWRLNSPLAGWLAGLFIALDGHFVGYARVAQYNTIDQLMSLVSLLVGIRLLQRPRTIAPSLLLIALYMGVGLLSHYEVAQTALPLLLILWALWRQGVKGATMVRGIGGAIAVGIVTLLVFYVPFFLNPNIVNTLDYLSENLVENREGHFPYNHLGDFFWTSTFYSTTYLTVAWVGLLAVAILRAYRRQWGWGGMVVALFLLTGLILGTVQPTLFVVGTYNLTVLWFIALMGGLWRTRLTIGERIVWLWFGVLWGVAAFVTAFPSLHYIPAFLPSALIIGFTLADATAALRRYSWGNPLLAGAGVAAVVGGIIVAGFTYRTFVYSDVEFIRTWNWQPEWGWTLNHPEGSLAIYGAPHQSGWKAVGMLYSMGILNGTYETNVQEAIAEWYIRRPERCERTFRYYFLELRERPRFQEEVLAQLAATHHHAGTILVRGEPRLAVYESGVGDNGTPWEYETTEMISAFDSGSHADAIRLDTPAILPQPEVRLDLQMGENFVVEGYTIRQPARQIGDFVHLTVYWRTLEKTGADFTTFTHLISKDDQQLYGQVDRRPGCTLRSTYQWETGREVVDHYEIPIADNAPAGTYIVRFGLYDSATLQRLPVQSATGEPIGDVIETEMFTLEP